MQFVGAIALQNAADVGQGVEVVLHALEVDHGLTTVIDGQGLVFHAFCGHIDLWH